MRVSLQPVNRDPWKSRTNAEEGLRKNLRGCYVRERMNGCMQHLAVLPTDVADKEAKATSKNCAPEVRFKKEKISPKTQIAIE